MKTILLKISGEVFNSQKASSKSGAFCMDKKLIKNIALQIKKLQKDYKIGVVIGGGNLFRGDKDGKQLGITSATAHQIGMLSTVINGIMLKDFFEKEKIECTLFSSFFCPQIANTIETDSINEALRENKCLIFSGGTGNPYFTTDTTAILRALQIGSSLVLKATKVDGVYDKDPEKSKTAKLIKKTSYEKVLQENLKVMDLTAITLAKQNNVKIKVFNLFKTDSILIAIKEKDFGTTITKE